MRINYDQSDSEHRMNREGDSAVADCPSDAVERSGEVVPRVRSGVLLGNLDIEVHDHPNGYLNRDENRGPKRHATRRNSVHTIDGFNSSDFRLRHLLDANQGSAAGVGADLSLDDGRRAARDVTVDLGNAAG